jgi:hypothetical protein
MAKQKDEVQEKNISASISLSKSVAAAGGKDHLSKFQKGADSLGLSVATVEGFAVKKLGISVVYHDEKRGAIKTFVED